MTLILTIAEAVVMAAFLLAAFIWIGVLTGAI